MDKTLEVRAALLATSFEPEIRPVVVAGVKFWLSVATMLEMLARFVAPATEGIEKLAIGVFIVPVVSGAPIPMVEPPIARATEAPLFEA